jgi:hypothetical protein
MRLEWLAQAAFCFANRFLVLGFQFSTLCVLCVFSAISEGSSRRLAFVLLIPLDHPIKVSVDIRFLFTYTLTTRFKN